MLRLWRLGAAHLLLWGLVVLLQIACSSPVSTDQAPHTDRAVGFRSAEALDQHWRKHRAEFGDPTRDQYLAQAQLLRDAPVGGDVLEIVRQDQVRTRFDRKTGAFLAFEANGTIRTFFRPNDGERYFHRQARRQP